MLYLISLGLTESSIAADALKIIKKCETVYLENYTVNFPYPLKNLETSLDVKITPLNREKIEDLSFLEEAKTKNIALLVYGDALSATTHTTIILESKKQNIPLRIFHNASILTSISETGLQLYKFGKTASMPNWKEHTNKPTSFMNYIKENQSIKAHALLLTDIGLEISSAILQLEEASEKEKIKIPEKIIVCSKIGTQDQKIFYDTPKNLKEKNIQMPFCLVIPGEMHFIEKEALESIII